jgi:hypothetical protein
MGNHWFYVLSQDLLMGNQPLVLCLDPGLVGISPIFPRVLHKRDKSGHTIFFTPQIANLQSIGLIPLSQIRNFLR